MNEQLQPEKSTEIHESLQRFKRESWWQVTFPVVAMGIIAVVLLVLLIIPAVKGDPGPASVAADYSLILLTILTIFGVLFALAVFAGLAYGVTLLIQKTPPYTSQAQSFMRKVHQKVDEVTDRIAHVVILARSALAGVEHFLRIQGIMPEQDEDSPQKGTSQQ